MVLLEFATKRIGDYPLQDKILYLFDLTYETLSELFEAGVLYDTNKITIKIKPFTTKEIQEALIKQLQYLLEINNENFEGDSDSLNSRGKIIDFLIALPGYDEEDIEDIAPFIQETMMMEQMRIYGLRELVFSSDVRMCNRYFNPNAEIVVEELNHKAHPLYCACQKHDDTAECLMKCQLNQQDCSVHTGCYEEDYCQFFNVDKKDFVENILRIHKYKSSCFDFSNLMAIDYNETGCTFVPIKKMYVSDLKNMFIEQDYMNAYEEMGEDTEIKEIVYMTDGTITINGWEDFDISAQDEERFALETELFIGGSTQPIEDILSKIE